MLSLTYSENIKGLMNWTDSQFSEFENLFKLSDSYYSMVHPSERLVLTPEYLEHATSLFLTLYQQNSIYNYFVNPRAIFIVFICFYLYEEKVACRQTKESVEVLCKTFTELAHLGLLTSETKTYAQHLISEFSDEMLENAALSDVVSPSDTSILRDLLTSCDPVRFMAKNGSGACTLRYNSDVMELTTRVTVGFKADITELYDAVFRRSTKIQNKFLRHNYIGKLHYLMELHSTHKITLSSFDHDDT